MENTSEQYILNKLTKNLTALIIQSTHEIENDFNDYFNELFIEVHYIDNYEKIKNYLKNNRPDYIFLDLQSNNIEPFQLIGEIHEINPKQVIIAMSALKDPDMLIHCIDYNISSFLLKPLNLTIIKNKIIHCLEYLVMNDPTIIYKTKLATLYETPYDTIRYLIDNKNFDIELINHYKGVPLIRQASIIDIDNENIRVKIKDIQKYILEYSQHSIISSRYLSYDIYAYLANVDKEKDIATFTKLSFIKSYVHHRQYIRVIPDSYFDITIIINNKKYKCDVVNISLKYALLNLSLSSDNLNINSEIQMVISFKLNNFANSNEFYSHTIQTKATINRILHENGDLRGLFHFELEEKENKLLEEYIHARSLALIKEFKRNNIPVA
ncbi:MAG: response regulator [Arcobacteraceae bacterium]|nr:response regulator [Arcobacteraceae bacterium]